ncbi:hypothetical protein DIPPA_20187 [Diplonema papillatum]|nr:hypothetical protein DIPPA_20187 [Diplonema papillatum]
MGCCFSTGAEGEGGMGLLLPRSETQGVSITTPVELEVPIKFAPCRVRIKLRADDARRTVEVSWLDAEEKERFDSKFISFGSRYTPKNQLSDKSWKTAQPYDVSQTVPKAGSYYLVVRSSLVVVDKHVEVRGQIIKEEVKERHLASPATMCLPPR